MSTSGSTLAEALMRQALFGESRGVGILRAFHGRYAGLFAAPLEQELRAQIADESRHARAYAGMLAKRGGAPVGVAGVDAGWRTIIGHIAATRSFSTTVIGMYGLLEPFNLLAMRTLLPLLDKADLAAADEIAKDEARHIGMFELFAELVDRGVLRIDAAECTAMIRVFMEALRAGIALPSGERASLPRGDWRDFMRHVAALEDRIQAWSALGANGA